MSDRIPTYAEFWPYYLREHANRACRVFHFLGTSFGILFLAATIYYMNPWYILGGLVSGYGPAWIGHFFIEKNRPATFQYPLWSLISDFRMFGLMVRGQLWGTSPVLQQAGITA